MFKISESKNFIAKFLRSKILENFKLESKLIKRAEKLDQSDLILAKMKSGKKLDLAGKDRNWDGEVGGLTIYICTSGCIISEVHHNEGFIFWCSSDVDLKSLAFATKFLWA